MSSQELSPIVVEMLVALADRADVSLEELCEGLAADERTLRAQGGLDWGVAAELIERLEARIGPERLRALAARVPDISSMGRRILGRFISPATMLRFVFGAVGPTMYPMYVTSYDEQPGPDGAIEFHVRMRLKDGFRDCRTMFDLHGVSTAALPSMIGQPPLPWRAETTGRGGDYWFTVR